MNNQVTHNVDEAQNAAFLPSHVTTNEIYAERLDAAWASLQADIDRWLHMLKQVAPKRAICHHVEQYKRFSMDAYDAFQQQIAQNGSLPETKVEIADGKAPAASRFLLVNDLDATEFRAVVIGILSARWGLLRQVALQRTSNSPYTNGPFTLDELDQHTATYYHRLRTTLPKPLRAKLAPFAPIVCLGSLVSLAIYNQRVPLVITVPYSAIDDVSPLQTISSFAVTPRNLPFNGSDLNRLSIPHEVGHAMLVQMPQILEELQEKLPGVLEKRSKASCARRRVLHAMISGWLEEILADLIGCALAGNQFFYSAIWIMATLDTHAGHADADHPPGLIRPLIHLKALEYLQGPAPKTIRGANIEQIRYETLSVPDLRDRYLAQVVGSQIGRQFKSMSALMFLTLEEIRTELELAIDCILQDEDLRLDAFCHKVKGKKVKWTMGEFLAACDANQEPRYTTELSLWGEIPEQERLNFVLDLSGGPPPDFHIPIADFNFIVQTVCRYLGNIVPCPS